MEGRLGWGLTWPPSAEAAMLAGTGRRGKQLKARRLSFTWQMHNSQGSPGDQICPTGNSTPLSSREQPGGRERGREHKWAEVPKSGLDAGETHSTARGDRQTPLLTRAASTQPCPGSCHLAPRVSQLLPSQHAPGKHGHTHTHMYTSIHIHEHSHSHTETHSYGCNRHTTKTHRRKNGTDEPISRAGIGSGHVDRVQGEGGTSWESGVDKYIYVYTTMCKTDN